MAKQKGIIRIKGKIGGMSFYQSNGTDLIREPGSVTKEQILNNPNFQRTRENMAEFAGAASAGRALRLGLASVLRTMKGRNLVGRITKLMKQVNEQGPGAREQRDIDFALNGMLLNGFEFSLATPLSSVLLAPLTYASTAARNEATLTVPDFNTSDLLSIPAVLRTSAW